MADRDLSEGSMQVYRPCMKRLMLAIGLYFSDDPELWSTQTYISTESSLYDFFLDEDEMQAIAAELQLTLGDDHRLLGNLADQMVERGDPN